ncbi:hypothetical protein NM045_1276 [Neisseria meningitidis NM045]|nr:hypothetical protein NM045_1276 [Neisseria meningitidis NM045]
MYFKSGQGDEAADSTIVRQGEATPYWFLLIHYTSAKANHTATFRQPVSDSDIRIVGDNGTDAFFDFIF